MFELDKTWQLDSRLANDSLALGTIAGCEVLMANDNRWPWIIVVPKLSGAEELFDLSPEQLAGVMRLASVLGDRLKSETHCEKINIAAIGNSVRQLHIHVVARSDGDPNWPRPIWGFGEAVPYSASDAEKLCTKYRKLFSDTTIS